jgi:hypothetical protein
MELGNAETYSVFGICGIREEANYIHPNNLIMKLNRNIIFDLQFGFFSLIITIKTFF